MNSNEEFLNKSAEDSSVGADESKLTEKQRIAERSTALRPYERTIPSGAFQQNTSLQQSTVKEGHDAVLRLSNSRRRSKQLQTDLDKAGRQEEKEDMVEDDIEVVGDQQENNDESSSKSFHQQEVNVNLVQASLVEEDGTSNPTILVFAEKAGNLTSQDQKFRRNVYIVLGLMFAAVIAAIIIVLVMVVPGRDDNEESKAEQATVPDESKPYVIDLPDYTLKAIEEDSNSPQSKAYSWLLNDPNFANYKEWRLKQRYALSTFFFATDGDNWRRNTDWLSYDVDECQWFWNEQFSNSSPCILYLTKNARYVDFNLYNNSLMGTIPKEISLLTDLQKINFGFNDLVGTIPTQLFSLPQVFSVALYHTGLIGTIPTEVGRLSKLRFLFMGATLLGRRTLLGGKLPSELGLLTRLTKLNFVDTTIEGPIPTQVGLMVGLRNISLSRNPKLDGSIPTEIGEAGNLEAVFFADSKIEGQLPSEIGKLAKLQKLALYSNRITGHLPSEMGLLQSLWGLWISSNSLRGTIPSEVGSMKNLSYLLLDSNYITGSVPSQIANLELKKADISENNMYGKIPDSLCMFDPSVFVFDCSPRLCGCHCICHEDQN